MTAGDTISVGIDVGGTNLRVGWLPAGAELTSPIDVVVDEAVPATSDAWWTTVERALDACRTHGTIDTVGVAVAGLVVDNTPAWIPNVAYLDAMPIAAELAAGAPVVVANDAHLTMLAEALDGAATGCRDALLLAIGTGIGSAVLSGGCIVTGDGGAACSFGWACADGDDRGDDVHGWLERHASGRALDRLGDTFDPPTDGAGLVAAARRGDPAATAAVATAATALGTTLAGAVGLLAPQRVIVAGGVARAFDQLEAPLRDALRRQLPPHLRSIDVVAARFVDSAGLVGAIAAGRAGAQWWEVRR